MYVESMLGWQTGGSFKPVSTNMNSEKRVLIVDDEADICLLLSGLLKRMGYQTTCAHFLEEGRLQLTRQEFDAVFLDLSLPDGVGFELLSYIRNINDSTKVVMISAFDGMAERNKATQEGADYFIGKPFNRKTIEQALQSIQL
ncbi:response regulator [Tellurirhabdus bombi]|uniref:response regulator n=1 Tax=Tellurirhabdus bombi TaxID=2907205 RepID=UPI001F47612E|nr:response regulator [Tellurirhabdus bombi]